MLNFIKKNIIVLLAISVIGIVAFNIPQTEKAEEIILGSSTLYEHLNTGSGVDVAISGVEDANPSTVRGQSFTPQTTHTITSVKVYLKKRGTASGSLYVYIKATSSGVPSGSVLASGSLAITNIGTSFAWEEITLGAGALLSASTQYSFYMVAPDCTSGNDVIASILLSDSYANGAEVDKENGGAWVSQASSYDILFEEWGEAVVTVIEAPMEVYLIEEL